MKHRQIQIGTIIALVFSHKSHQGVDAIIKGGTMPSRHFILFSFLVAMTQSVQAEETKTTYSIAGSNATVTTVVKKASAETEQQMLRGFLFERLAAKLKQFPMVTGVEFNNQIKAEIKSSEWSDYWEHKRGYPVMVHLSLPTAVTMMFKVEETFRKCKSPAEKAAKVAQPVYDDYGGGGGLSDVTVDCSLGSQVKVTGPYTVYGNFASSMDIERLLREKQSISYDVTRDWSDKTNLKIEGRFSIESELFDQSLMKFLGGLNAKPAGTESILTRNNLLLGIARILRVQNERMVE